MHSLQERVRNRLTCGATTSNLYPRSASRGSSPDLLINNRVMSSVFLREPLVINCDHRSAEAIAVTRQYFQVCVTASKSSNGLLVSRGSLDPLLITGQR